MHQRYFKDLCRRCYPEDGPDHIAVYLDNILVFSKNLAEHDWHLCQVFDRLENVGLKLNPNINS